MLLEALYHVPRDKWAYAYDTKPFIFGSEPRKTTLILLLP